MKRLSLSLLCLFSLSNVIAQTITGELKKWHKITLSSELPVTELTEGEATFKNYRMDVIFTGPNSEEIRVPGFFDADGDPANTNAKAGKTFKAFLRPNQLGEWTYKVLFYTGTDIALKTVATLPAPTLEQTGIVGTIVANDKELPDLRAQGRLQYKTTGTNNERRYLQFAETGEYFLKLGPDSPENILDYNEFDHDVSKNGCALCTEHKFNPHAAQYFPGNPTWGAGKGKNIIGALNYLKNQKMNSVSMSLFGGDDKNVFPWINPNSKFTYDVSKLAQWEIVLNHAEQNGLLLHLKLAENENWDKLNSNQLKIYYREMIARFGHHLAVEWNFSEEYRGTPASAIERIDYMAANDPWQNHRVIHTYPNEHNKYQDWLNLNAKLTGASVQSSTKRNYASAFDGPDGILTWINNSKNNNTPWVVASDEQNPGSTGIFNSAEISDSSVKKEARTRILWKTHLAGGQGVMWYGGGQGDFKTENFDRFTTLFEWSRYAVLHFFKNNKIEFWKTVNSDNLVSGTGNNCLAEIGKTYVIYLENGGTTNLNLTGQTGNYSVKWFNPREGGALVNGSTTTIAGGTNISIGTPPNQASQDWVALIRLAGSEPTPDPIEVVDNSCTFKLEATTDFPNTAIAGFAAATKNNPTGTLSVDSTRFPNMSAAATTTFTGTDGVYKLKINTVAEEDGESTYKISINGVEVASFTNPESTQAFEDTSSDFFEDIVIKNGDEIQVEFNSISNGKIPENGGFAFARGRWRSLEISCPNVTTPNPGTGDTGGRGDKCEYDFEEIGGLAILEAESFDTGSTKWIRKNEKTGFTGTSYLEWTGNDFFGQPGNGIIEGKIKINTPGKYRFQWRSRVGEGNNSTEANDSWLKFPDADDFFGERGASIVYPKGSGKTPVPNGGGGSGWFKIFLNGTTDWTFTSRTSDNDGHDIFVQFDNPGIYTIQISGRSKHHLIDRVVLSNTGNAVSETGAETRCPDANPVPLPNDGEEVNLLDCSKTPANLKIDKLTPTSVTVSFTNRPDDKREFELRAYNDESPFTGALSGAVKFQKGNSGESTVTMDGLESGVEYEFVFRSICRPGGSPVGRISATLPLPASIALDNFEIEVIGESCPDSDDGSILINAKSDVLNYTAVVTNEDGFSKTEKFNEKATISELSPGKYTVIITVEENKDFSQKIKLDVRERPVTAVKEIISRSSKQLTLSLSGGTNYKIELNDQTFFTSDNEFTVNLVNGENNLTVKADKDCQGTHSNKILIDTNQFSMYPNPVKNNLNITLANPEETVLITVHDIIGKVIKQINKSGTSAEIRTDLSLLESGIYFVTVQGKNTNQNVKIIKK